MNWHWCHCRHSLPSDDVIESHCEDCDTDSQGHTCKNNTNAHKTAGFHARRSCAGQGDVNNCLDRGLKYNPFIWTLFSSLGHTHTHSCATKHTLLLPSVAEDRAESVTFLCLQLFSLAHAWFSVPADGWENQRRTTEPGNPWLHWTEATWMFEDKFYLDCAQWGKQPSLAETVSAFQYNCDCEAKCTSTQIFTARTRHKPYCCTESRSDP